MCESTRRWRLVAVVLARSPRTTCGDSLNFLASCAPTSGVRALDLLVDALADVVEQPGAARDLDVEPQLAGHDAGQHADLDRVLQQVLRVRRSGTSGGRARAPARGAPCAGRGRRPPARRPPCTAPRSRRSHLATTSSMRVGWMRPSAISRVERQLGDLAPHRVEAGDDHRLGRVVDDQVDAGRRLERADVAALAADDAALHVVRRAAAPPRRCARRRTRRRSAGSRCRGCAWTVSSASAFASSSIFFTSTAAVLRASSITCAHQLGWPPRRSCRPASRACSWPP